jgi:hypothetical protein
MTSPMIAGYVAGLHRRLPVAIADEAADGLIETYEHHLASGAGEQAAAHAALAEFGDLGTVAGEFTRQAPGRRAARMLLATGPVAGACWATALILGRAWTWPAPAAARLSFGAVLPTRDCTRGRIRGGPARTWAGCPRTERCSGCPGVTTPPFTPSPS